MRLPRPLGASPNPAAEAPREAVPASGKEAASAEAQQKAGNQVDFPSPDTAPAASQSKKKDQMWGDQQAEARPARPSERKLPQAQEAPARSADTRSSAKSQASVERKRSAPPVAEERPTKALEMPQPKRGCSSLAAKQHRMIKHHRPITKRVQLEQPKLEEDNYEISDLEEDMHGNRVEPDRTKKRIPQWCANYVKIAETQAEVDPDSIFGSHMPICDLETCQL